MSPVGLRYEYAPRAGSSILKSLGRRQAEGLGSHSSFWRSPLCSRGCSRSSFALVAARFGCARHFDCSSSSFWLQQLIILNMLDRFSSSLSFRLSLYSFAARHSLSANRSIIFCLSFFVLIVSAHRIIVLSFQLIVSARCFSRSSFQQIVVLCSSFQQIRPSFQQIFSPAHSVPSSSVQHGRFPLIQSSSFGWLSFSSEFEIDSHM